MASTGVLPATRTQSVAVSRVWLWPALIGLVPVVFILVATRNGIGMSPDSNSYALPVTSGSWTFHPSFPLGLPTLLVATGIGFGAVLVNCGAVWANMLVTYALARTVSGSRAVAFAVAAWMGASVATAQVHSMLWSEPIFCAAVNAALLCLVQIVKNRELSPALLAGLIVASNIAGATRWALMFLLPVVGLALLFVAQGALWPRLVKAAWVTAACGFTVAAGILGNLAVGRKATGNRIPPEMTHGRVLFEVPVAAAGYVQNTLSPWTVGNLGYVVLVTVVLLVVTWFLRERRLGSAHVLAGWFVVYLASFIATSMTTRIDPLGFRLSAPVFAAGIILLFTAASRLLPPRFCWTLYSVSLTWLLLTTSGWAYFAGATGGLTQF